MDLGEKEWDRILFSDADADPFSAQPRVLQATEFCNAGNIEGCSSFIDQVWYMNEN